MEKTTGPHHKDVEKILQLPEVISVTAEYVELVNIIDSSLKYDKQSQTK